jgi:archaemetzincin
VHEVGHTFGLVHCPDRHCPMSLSIDLPDLDGKTAVPCPACRAMIEGSREMGLARRRVEGEHP